MNRTIVNNHLKGSIVSKNSYFELNTIIKLPKNLIKEGK